MVGTYGATALLLLLGLLCQGDGLVQEQQFPSVRSDPTNIGPAGFSDPAPVTFAVPLYGSVLSVNLALQGLSYTSSGEIELYLRSPSGAGMFLMVACPADFPPCQWENSELRFTDSADICIDTFQPDQNSPGRCKPGNYTPAACDVPQTPKPDTGQGIDYSNPVLNEPLSMSTVFRASEAHGYWELFIYGRSGQVILSLELNGTNSTTMLPPYTPPEGFGNGSESGGMSSGEPSEFEWLAHLVGWSVSVTVCCCIVACCVGVAILVVCTTTFFTTQAGLVGGNILGRPWRGSESSSDIKSDESSDMISDGESSDIRSDESTGMLGSSDGRLVV